MAFLLSTSRGTVVATLNPRPVDQWQLEMKFSKIDSANDQQTKAKLESTIVENIRWSNIDIQSALDDLTYKLKEEHPGDSQLRFLLHLPVDMKKPDQLGRTVNRKLWIILSKTDLFTLMLYISEQSNLSFRLQKDAVTFIPLEEGAYRWTELDQ
jgi:hypothetical protein